MSEGGRKRRKPRLSLRVRWIGGSSRRPLCWAARWPDHLSMDCEGSGGWKSAKRRVGDAYIQYLPENQIYSACQQCNTQCGTKVKIVDGMVAKIDGNPYSPWTLTPHIPYDTPLAEAATVDGSLCPKGQAGIQALYDPYRLVKVVKRAGKRGENKWKTIAFEEALKRSSRAATSSAKAAWTGSRTFAR